jgi:PHP family Zn ribbon phosphoesterase
MKQHKKYAVIVCNKCKQPKIVETKQKTTKCMRCGKTIQLSKTVFVFETNNISEARQVIGQINAEQDNHLDEFKDFLKQTR